MTSVASSSLLTFQYQYQLIGEKPDYFSNINHMINMNVSVI